MACQPESVVSTLLSLSMQTLGTVVYCRWVYRLVVKTYRRPARGEE